MKRKSKVTIAACICLTALLMVCVLTIHYTYAKKNNNTLTSSISDAVKIEDHVIDVINEDSIVEQNSNGDGVESVEASINNDEKNAVGNSKENDKKNKEDDKGKKDSSSNKKTISKDDLPQIVSIKMENINQYPELPTGCESVATTMLLNYYGFNLEKTTFADEYLIYADNFVTGYSGNPHSYDGGGCYAPGLVKSTNEFLLDKKSDLTACNVTGSKPEELYWYVANDMPVVIWSTVYMLENQPSGSYYEYRGKTYEWDRCEHCMVLCGYDLTNNTVLINDPIDGIVERDAERFWRYYENLGSMAMIIY